MWPPIQSWLGAVRRSAPFHAGRTHLICPHAYIAGLSAQLRIIAAIARFRARLWSVHPMIRTLFWLLDELLNLYIWAVIIAALFSMLASFGVLDTRNRTVWMIGDFLYRLTEPALRPIRNILPNFGNIDLSPLILLLLLQAARMLLGNLEAMIITGSMQYLL
jgi:YggT family protein